MDKEVCGICYGRFEIVVNSKNSAKQLETRRADTMSAAFDNLSGVTPLKKSATSTDTLATPRPLALGPFALFVKEKYNLVKHEKKLTSQKDIMQELSKQFKAL